MTVQIRKETHKVKEFNQKSPRLLLIEMEQEWTGLMNPSVMFLFTVTYL